MVETTGPETYIARVKEDFNFIFSAFYFYVRTTRFLTSRKLSYPFTQVTT